MWDLIYELPWVWSVILGVVAASLLPSLLISLIQSRQLRKRFVMLQKELNAMTDCSMGMGAKMVTLEKVFSEGGLQLQTESGQDIKSATARLEKAFSYQQSVNDSCSQNARVSDVGQGSRFRKANQLLMTGAAPELVMVECGVSKAEIDLMRLLESKGTELPKETAE